MQPKLDNFEVAFVLNIGGLGDYIHWTTAIRYAIEQNDHIRGRIYVPHYFRDLADLWFAPYVWRFQVCTHDSIKDDPRIRSEKNVRLRSAFDSVTAVYHHSMNVGFYTYAMESRIPDEWFRLPRISGEELDVGKFSLPEKYVVVTTEATSQVRRLTPELINKLSAWLRQERGLTPVFLGKSEISTQHKTLPAYALDHWALDLREKTTLLEAAVILARARLVIGLDNGLLHLAACSDVPIVAAFTTADPKLRLVPREGKTITIEPPLELECRYCQSKYRFLRHDFRNCLRGDIMCCQVLGADVFIEAAERILC